MTTAIYMCNKSLTLTLYSFKSHFECKTLTSNGDILNCAFATFTLKVKHLFIPPLRGRTSTGFT